MKTEQMPTDDLDYKLLRELLINARNSSRKLAMAVGKSALTIIKRIEKLESAGIIKGYSAVLDFDKLGYNITAVINLKVAKGKLKEVETRIAKHPNVFSVYDVTGSYDTVVLARFKSVRSLDNFLKLIQTYPFVEGTQTSIALNVIKENKQIV